LWYKNLSVSLNAEYFYYSHFRVSDRRTYFDLFPRKYLLS